VPLGRAAGLLTCGGLVDEPERHTAGPGPAVAPADSQCVPNAGWERAVIVTTGGALRHRLSQLGRPVTANGDRPGPGPAVARTNHRSTLRATASRVAAPRGSCPGDPGSTCSCRRPKGESIGDDAHRGLPGRPLGADRARDRGRGRLRLRLAAPERPARAAQV